MAAISHRYHAMTPARMAALRKAQRASAKARRRKSKRGRPKNVTLYHYTTQRRARKIVRRQNFQTSSRLLSPGNVKGQVYFTRRRSNFYKKEFYPAWRKTAVVSVKVSPKYVKPDPNDVWFRPIAQRTGAKHSVPRAYMVDKRNLVGHKIKAM